MDPFRALHELAASLPAERRERAIVFGSAALALRGVALGREPGDVDLLMEGGQGPAGPGPEVLAAGIEALGELPGVDVAAVAARSAVLPRSSGFRVAAVADVVAWKRHMDRPKDRADLAAVAAWSTAGCPDG